MTPKLNEGAVKQISQTLTERFGEPIASPAMKCESVNTCSQCGGMMKLEGDTCSECGMMSPLGEVDRPDNDNGVAKPVSYEIVDTMTGRVIGKSSTQRSARISADRRDEKYGAHRYQVRPKYA